MINSGVLFNVAGALLLILGGFMLTALPFSFYYDTQGSKPIICSALTTLLVGFGLWYTSRNSNKKIGKREGFLIVTIGWVIVSMFSTSPYLFSSVLPELTNSLFESVSGLTTTGSSVINDIESVPKSILY